MSEPRQRYIVYLLRLWRARCGAEFTWRASLESTRGGERLGFASLDELLAFLCRRTSEEEEVGDKPQDCKGRRSDSEIL